jgi:hypothetical protein
MCVQLVRDGRCEMDYKEGVLQATPVSAGIGDLGPFWGRRQACLAAFNAQVLHKLAIVMRTREAEACAHNIQPI